MAMPEMKRRNPRRYSSSSSRSRLCFKVAQRESCSFIPQGSLSGRWPVKQQVRCSSRAMVFPPFHWVDTIVLYQLENVKRE